MIRVVIAACLILFSLAASAAGMRLAIVAEDRVALRAAARDSATQHALLWQGDTLELRGERLDFLQVYDHARERAGFVRATQVRVLDLQEQNAAALRAVLLFLRDSPGLEALGIAYAAAFLKAAPPEAIDADTFEALGVLAERLGRRASTASGKANEAVLAAHLEVAGRYGVRWHSFESDGRLQLCYEGDAFRRVLALAGSAEQQARAALALTRPDCIDPDLGPLPRFELDLWRAELLDRVPGEALNELWRNRLRLRIAAVRASLAYSHQRRGESGAGNAQRARRELAGVDRKQLAEIDVLAYEDAALRVAASRWAESPSAPAAAGLSVRSRAGTQPGESCIELFDSKRSAEPPLFDHCTFATVWLNSARSNAQGTALALAVQPLAAWRELWLFQHDGKHWRLDVLPPAADAPELGYLEFAGWVPGQRQLLAAREARQGGRFQRSFEIISMDSLAVLKRAEQPEHLSPFYRHQDASWKRQTLALRP